MSMPFYVSPEQVMKDRADYARKGIARGRSLVALECEPGILIVADNPSKTLSKISEIYDRIDFDRSKIDEIRPTGRHKKALQWYVDDLRSAERDLDRCRYGDDTARYDPYGWDGRDAEYDDSERPFDWKRDWPELLGAVLYPTR